MHSVYKEEVYSVYTCSDEIILNFVWPSSICKDMRSEDPMSPGRDCGK